MIANITAAIALTLSIISTVMVFELIRAETRVTNSIIELSNTILILDDFLEETWEMADTNEGDIDYLEHSHITP